ncbi:N-acetylglucosaminyldiphosphodolichol N-acetylglucosaminyltransferase catalytic subunit alg13 [Cytospora paraplurivora]|uniref:UDP-N-acetylglucosamine transferase subunit ALG13 n=1 Tax=Cytospora paraplurivora TaxID=2898453 RepID=A0AAN9YFG4_9PEZI
MGRKVLVTGGATVPFKELLHEVCTPDFIATLEAYGFTDIDIQCGSHLDAINSELLDNKCGLIVTTFSYNNNLKREMAHLCRGEAGNKPAGVVIGHAGTGTISDALEAEAPLIVVANPNLMDNHQADFAAEMAAEHPTIIQGHLGKLAEAIPKIMEVIKENGLDDLQPLEQGTLPVGKGDGLSFIDEVIEYYQKKRNSGH